MLSLITETVISFFQQHSFWGIAVLLFMPFALFWNYYRRRKTDKVETVISKNIEPIPLNFNFIDYIKALISWLFLFMKIYIIKPGLYYIGQNEKDAPLLVTANNFLTVFLLVRRIKKRNVRLLVLDTKGINVWCSAGKGQFSDKEIISKADHFGLLNSGNKLKIILPKFSLSGVNLKELRKNGIRPIIGPLYAKDVPGYLDEGSFSDQTDDIVNFGLKSRIFTALPTAVQFFYYFLTIYVISLDTLPYHLIWLATGLAFLYPLLFPLLPGKLFAIKGLFLALFISIISMLIINISFSDQLSLIIFIFATSVFIALSYTGNSAVSNYSSVRKEIARFYRLLVFFIF